MEVRKEIPSGTSHMCKIGVLIYASTMVLIWIVPLHHNVYGIKTKVAIVNKVQSSMLQIGTSSVAKY